MNCIPHPNRMQHIVHNAYRDGYRGQCWRVTIDTVPSWFERVVLRHRPTRHHYYGSGNVWRSINDAPNYIRSLCMQAVKDLTL